MFNQKDVYFAIISFERRMVILSLKKTRNSDSLTSEFHKQCVKNVSKGSTNFDLLKFQIESTLKNKHVFGFIFLLEVLFLELSLGIFSISR